MPEVPRRKSDTEDDGHESTGELSQEPNFGFYDTFI
jgi:hypothetical protein